LLEKKLDRQTNSSCTIKTLTKFTKLTYTLDSTKIYEDNNYI